MIIITIYLSALGLPSIEDGDEIMHKISHRVFKRSIHELDPKFTTDTWYFVPTMFSMSRPYPEMTLCMEIDNYYYYDGISNDVLMVFRNNWKKAIENYPAGPLKKPGSHRINDQDSFNNNH